MNRTLAALRAVLVAASLTPLAVSAVPAAPAGAAGGQSPRADSSQAGRLATVPRTLLAGHSLVADSKHASLANGWYSLNVYSAFLELDESIPLPGSDGTSTSTTGTWMRQDPTGKIQPQHDRSVLRLRSNGDLVLRTSWGARLWHSDTAGSGAVRLTLHQRGNLALHTESGKVVWQSHSGQVQLSGGMTLGPGERLRDAWETAFKGGKLVTLTMQKDGNLVHRCGGAVDWQTHTHVKGSSLKMRSDGLLRVVTPKGRTVWSSHSGGHDYAWLNGKRMMINADGIDLIWYAQLNYAAC